MNTKDNIFLPNWLTKYKKLIYSIIAGIIFIILVLQLTREATPVIYPERKEIIEAVYASGKIVPENEYKLSALSNGTIVQKLIVDGDTVTKGQVLYIVSNEAASEKFEAALKNYEMIQLNLSDQSPLLSDLSLSLQNAVVKFRNDSATYQRWKNLWDKQIGTKSNLENTYSNYQVSLNHKNSAEQKYYSAVNDLQVSLSNARSQVTAAKKELNEYYIRSDRKGMVYQTFKEVGEVVHNSEVVALIGEYQKRVIRLAVDQADIDKIRIGQQVLLQADVTGTKIYEATVSCIFPVMNEIDQTFRVDAHFNELPGQTFIYSSIEANIIVQRKKNALVVPRVALTANDSVWIQHKGKEKKIGVRTGILTLDFVEILSGIDENTAVLLTQNN